MDGWMDGWMGGQNDNPIPHPSPTGHFIWKLLPFSRLRGSSRLSLGPWLLPTSLFYKDTILLNSRCGNFLCSWAALRRELVPTTLFREGLK
jgi:hypothetical protein